MKKVIYLLVVMAVFFVGCNPLEDINAEIDAIPGEPNVGAFEYTLTDDDYETLDLGFGSFNSEQEAKDLVPQLLTELYPLYGQGSSVLVNYNLYIGSAEGVSDYTGSDVYSFSNADYAATGSDAFGFYPNVNPTDEIPAILATQIVAPAEGQIVLAKYKQYFEDPTVGLANLYQAAFPGDVGNFELISVSGPDALGWTEGSANVQGSGFDGGAVATEEWLISPEVDLSGESDLLFQITQEIDFLGDPDLIDILVSTNYTTGGDVAAATWTALAFDKTIYGSLTTSEDFDFSAYDGETIHVGLKYSSTDSDSPRWRVQDFAIKAIGVSGDTNSKGEYFMYSGGSWEAVDNVYYLSSADFDSMGTGSGQPGQYNNFSSSTSPNNYLPAFMEITFPYGQEEEELFVIYDYYSSSSGAQRRGNLYTLTGGMWTGHQSTIQTSLQFGYDNGLWVPDNTIRHTIAQSDYDYIAANYSATDGFADAVSSMAQYGNFDRRSSNAAYWSDAMLTTVFADLLDNVIAPNADNDQKYVLTFDIYNGSNTTEDFSFIKTDGEWVINEN
jgi:hypothetical protein